MARLHIGFIGLGLIGGSIARALRENISEIYMTAYDINGTALDKALQDGVIDQAAEQIDGRFSDCDYLFLCAPVQKNDANLETVKKFISPSCTLTDVGSVKTDIHQHIAKVGLEAQFIGGHPMAGSERFGYANSKAKLLENAYLLPHGGGGGGDPGDVLETTCSHQFHDAVLIVRLPHQIDQGGGYHMRQMADTRCDIVVLLVIQDQRDSAHGFHQCSVRLQPFGQSGIPL